MKTEEELAVGRVRGGGAPDECCGGDRLGREGVGMVQPGLAGTLAGNDESGQCAGALAGDCGEDGLDVVLAPPELYGREVALVPGHGTAHLARAVGGAVTLVPRGLGDGEPPPYNHLCPLRMPDVGWQPRLLALPLAELARRPRRIAELVLGRACGGCP